jgi:hypothetical protein
VRSLSASPFGDQNGRLEQCAPDLPTNCLRSIHSANISTRYFASLSMTFLDSCVERKAGAPTVLYDMKKTGTTMKQFPWHYFLNTAKTTLAYSLVVSIFIFTSSGQIVFASSGKAKPIETGTISKSQISGVTPQRIIANRSAPESSLRPRLLTPAEFCSGNLAGAPTWAINGWIIGNEIYKSYQDPTINCPGGAYPFLIDTVHIILSFSPNASTPLPLPLAISVDIESIDSSSPPGCSVPGNVIFRSPVEILSIPAAGLFDISIPLATPFEVSGPYFVGFRFEDSVPNMWGVQIVTDDIEAQCVSYNNWDSAVGFVDLGNDTLIHHHAYAPLDACYSAPPNTPGCFDFDGRLLLFSTGTLSTFEPCCVVAGDSDHDGVFNLADVTFAIARIFSRGIAPVCQDEIDANGDGMFNISDVSYGVARLFGVGPAPVCGTTGA